MGKILGLAHIGMFVDDLDRSLDFYTNVLGFKKFSGWTGKHNRVALLRLGTCTLEMMQPLEKKEFALGRYAHVALTVSNIEEVYKTLLDKGIKFNSEEITVNPTWGPTGAKYILFNGPDGETIEIAEAM